MSTIHDLSNNALRELTTRVTNDVNSGVGEVNLAQYLPPLKPCTVAKIMDEENTPINVLHSLKREYQNSQVKLALSHKFPEDESLYHDIADLSNEPEMLLSDFFAVIYFFIAGSIFNKRYVAYGAQNQDAIMQEVNSGHDNAKDLDHLYAKLVCAIDLARDSITDVAAKNGKISITEFDKTFYKLEKVEEFYIAVERLRFLMK